MTALRLRVLKRHTSLEAANWEEFYRAELLRRDGKPDLDLSVFDVDVPRLVQTHAEYVVSLLDPPCKRRGGLALGGVDDGGDAAPSPGATLFAYTQTRHVELRFLREADLRAMAERLFEERAQRCQAAEPADVRAHGRGRLAANDAEWIEACQQRPKWRKELAKT